MKNRTDPTTNGARIEALERQALRGRLSRRVFIASLTSLGVSLASARTMAADAEAAARNQRERRACLEDVYDYIIVGAGSAGCLLANRISATGRSVLLIEAGTNQVEELKVADSAAWLQNIGSDSDWNRVTVAQPGLAGRQLSVPSGKTLGGSGSINAMFWLRGDVRDYERWHELVGGAWNPRSLLDAFQRIENYLPADQPLRGRSGPIGVGRYSSDNPLTHASVGAGEELGLDNVHANAARYIDGVGAADVNILPDGRRSGPAQAYLVPAMARTNLTVLTGVPQTTLITNGSRCLGVNAVVDGQFRRFIASCEVVLSAGTFGSPQILMLSGIGDDSLTAAGIRVRHRLPAVGKNLQDHVFVLGALYTGGSALSSSITLGVIASHAFLRTNPTTAAPNIQIMCMQSPFPPGLLPIGGGFSILPWLVKPSSRGTIALTSGDPGEPLAIDPAYLSTTSDIDALSTSLDLAFALGSTRAMSPFVGQLVPPASRNLTPAEKRAFIAANAASGLHYVGTCAAGRDPATSVVNHEFRVWGMEGLRIVDGSVVPEIPGVNAQAPILTVAELAAETMLSIA